MASDVSLLDQMPGFSESGVDTRQRRLWPEDASEERGACSVSCRHLRRSRATSPTTRRTSTSRSAPCDRWSPGHNRILPIQLTELVAKYQPALTLAGYHSVDGFSHRYWRERLEAAASAGDRAALPLRGRRARNHPRRPRRLLGTFNLLVVSDHGFDFEAGHHTLAPPGIFFGWGPAFEAGRRLERLHVYDVAPMILDLVGLPVANDMPGAAPLSGEPLFRNALSAEQRQTHEVPRTPSYGRRKIVGSLSETPFEQETLEKLRSLGYIE